MDETCRAHGPCRSESGLLKTSDSTDIVPARPRKPAMARVHHQRREEILVQQGDQAEFMGDARSLQRSFSAEHLRY